MAIECPNVNRLVALRSCVNCSDFNGKRKDHIDCLFNKKNKSEAIIKQYKDYYENVDLQAKIHKGELS